MCEGAFGAELAVALRYVSQKVRRLSRSRYGQRQEATYLSEVLTRGVHGRNVGRMRKGACFSSLTLTETEELARNMRSI